jgi:hypothetical protein
MAANLLYWMGIGAARESAASEEAERPIRNHWAISAAVGFFLAAFVSVGLVLLLLVQQ